MKKETISSLDLNYSNSGGGHTATISTVLSAKNLDGSGGLGTVIGDLGEDNIFSNDEISKLLTNFICVDLTTNSDPVKKTMSRQYMDRTSLTLKSIIVLVRGVNCSPQGGKNYIGGVPYFTEVSNSPLDAFPSKGPEREGSVICAGRIYNYEAAAKFDGVKIALCYNDHELQETLSLNLDAIGPDYLAQPDLAQFELKYGYTIDDVKEMVGLADLQIEGLPSAEDVLFETSGTLESVLSDVASTLGCFWYVDPETGVITFINTTEASKIPITNYSDTDDPNIISASFTESLVTSKLVNTYVGTAEKQEGSDITNEERPRPVFFRRVDFTHGLGPHLMVKEEVKPFFALFNQEADTDTFDKYVYIITHLNKPTADGGSVINTIFGDKLKEQFRAEGVFDWKEVYDFEPINNELHWFGPNLTGNENEIGEDRTFADFWKPQPVIFTMSGGRFDENNPSEIGIVNGKGKIQKRTGEDGFYYYLMTAEGGKKGAGGVGTKKFIMPKPSSKKIHAVLTTFFSIAGGFYTTNGYSKYKVERMQFDNTSDLSIIGPFKGDQNIKDIDELSNVNDFADQLNIDEDDRLVVELAKWTDNCVLGANDGKDAYFFLGLRNLPKLERKNVPVKEGEPPQAQLVDFAPLENVELFQHPRRKHALFVGGPDFGDNDFSEAIVNIMKQSKINFEAAIGENEPDGEKTNTLKLTYTRSKTRVNTVDEEKDEKEEDDDEARKGDSAQKESELADRYDLRSYHVEAPPYNILNNLSLGGSSGSTMEMSVMMNLRGEYKDGVDKPKTSTRTLYGLHIPDFSPTMNSVSVKIGGDGIQTTVSESTIKLIPPSQGVLMNRGMEAVTAQQIRNPFSAQQRNALRV